MTCHSDVWIAELRAAVADRVVVPGDAGYDRARKVSFGRDRRPAAVIRARDADDISRTVSFARERGLELAVRGGGHSPAGHGTTDGGIVLDLAGMKRLDIDLERGTAWAEAGLTAGEYTAAVGVHGLATGFGDTGTVGIGGVTLSGGIGYLVRKHGLTIDSLLAADVVTADGQSRRVDARTHPDLFWAIRGGGGNFGVATRFRYRLHEVDRVVAGTLWFPATPETLVSFLAQAQAAPEELTTVATVMPTPPAPGVPVADRGRLVIRGTLVHAGDAAASERAVAPFRALAESIADTIRPTRYREMFPPSEAYHAPTAVFRTMFVDALDGDAAETILTYLRRPAAPMRVAQLRVLGGAMARTPADATAFAHRTSRQMVTVSAFYERPDQLPASKAWLSDFVGAIGRTDGAYVGFLGDEGEARVRAAYPGRTWERLTEIKRRYDPTNLFRLNQNIAPDSGDRAA